MKKIRVVHVITRMDQGGSAIDTAWMVKALDKEKYSSSLICGSLNQLTSEEERELKNACEIFAIEPSIKRNPHPYYDFVALCKLYKFFKKYRFDIVHTHTSKAGFVGRLAAALSGSKIIVHCPHGHIFYGYFSKLKTYIYIMMERLVTKYTDKILFCTELDIQDHLDVKVGRKEIYGVIPSGVQIDKYLKPITPPDKVRESLGIPLSAKVIGGVARIDHVKGVKYLVEAFFKLAGNRADIYLIIAGEGDERQELTELIAKNGYETRALLLGQRNDIPDLYHAMDIFVLSSLNEGYGKVLVEAMSASRPVIASRVGGIPTIVQDGITGILVPPGDAEAIAEAANKLLDSPELAARMGDAGQKAVKEGRSVEAMINILDNFYSELIKKKAL